MGEVRNLNEIANIIEALGRHSDESGIRVLEEIGTNSQDEMVRELTAKALIGRNSHESLKLMLIYKGKGIHDLNAQVVETAINSIKSLPDKAEVVKILDDTINFHSDDDVRFKAQLVKELI